jgi:hypothetical protein
MKIGVVSRWYNEEFFAPFFLNHYHWADEVVILLEKSSSDKSAQIVSKYKNARVEFCVTDELLNDRLLSDIVSDQVAKMDCDWVVRADADEFIFPKHNQDPREVLEKADGNLILAWYRWVYQHRTESKLNPKLPTVPQRLHGGVYTIWKGMGDRYSKPTIVRPDVQLRWFPGDQRHQPNSKVRLSSTAFDGVHWQMADVEHAIARNIKNESRLSEENKKNNWGVKNFTPEMIREECERHLDDPLLVF